MPLSCHESLIKIREKVAFTVLLAGNPNVGKSTLFNRLTGLGVVTANYPGKTVELAMGSAHYTNGPDGEDIAFGVVDLPGTYSLGAVSEDQWVARRAILERSGDLVVAVVDATNLERNLFLVLQLLDLGFPAVMALNLMDQARKEKIVIDPERLSQSLGIPVVPIVAATGEGVPDLVRICLEVVNGKQEAELRSPIYGDDIEHWIRRVVQDMETPPECPRGLAGHRHRHRFRAHSHPPEYGDPLPYGLSPRALALLLLEQDGEFLEEAGKMPQGGAILTLVQTAAHEIEARHGEAVHLRLARERHGLAGEIADQVEKREKTHPLLSSRLYQATLRPWTGIPILVGVLAAVFVLMYFVGGFLSGAFGTLWSAYLSPAITWAFTGLFGASLLTRILLWGFDAGIQAALSVGIPFVIPFYFLLAAIEDSGYLNSIAYLADSLMHKLGLHGRAIISLVAGLGCSVPAIIGTRVLTTRRERVIASTLITLSPCSARTAVIMGAVALFVGFGQALGVFGIVLFVTLGAGLLLQRLLPGRSAGLVMEMFPFRVPKLPVILAKTWHRLKDFLFVAFPVIIVGSLVMGWLYETKLMWRLVGPLHFVVETWLGLPPIAGLCLLFAILRKEMALQLLISLAIIQHGAQATNLLTFMTKEQLFIFALVNALNIPCVATMSALARELGWRQALSISLFDMALAVGVGGLAHQAWRSFP